MTGVGLLGCGAIGSELALAVVEGRAGDARLVGLFDQDGARAAALAASLPVSVACCDDFEEFRATEGMRLVVECASRSAVRALAPRVLEAGLDLLVISSGGLAEPTFFRQVSHLAVENGCRLVVPSGALGGIDAVRAARGLLDEVSLTTTKRPAALSGAPGYRAWEGKNLTEPTVVFEGSALEAIDLFPANVNVGITLSLAGIGPERTRIRIVADPASSGNVHEVVARGAFGVASFRLENQPHVTNARTSYLAVLSAIEALRSACAAGPRIGT